MNPRPGLASLFLAAAITLSCAAAQTTTKPSQWTKTLEQAMRAFQSGKIAEATQLAQATLRTAEKQYTKEEAELVKPLLFLSSLQIMQRQHEAAEKLTARARKITERELAAARERLATTLKYQGAIYTQAGKLAKAEQVYARAVEISEDAVGASHPETAKHLGNLASMLLRRKQHDRAEKVFARAMQIWAKQPAPDPVYTVGAMCNLAELRMAQDRAIEAIELYRRAVTIQENVFGKDDPRLRNTRTRYVKTLRRAGREAEAREVEAKLKRDG